MGTIMTKIRQLMSRKKTSGDILAYLLGLTSTIQIFEVFGITLFTIMTLICGGFIVLTRRRLYFGGKWFLVYFLSVAMSVLASVTLLPSYHIPREDDWIKYSVEGALITTMLYFAYVFLITDKGKKRTLFFRGLYHSCVLQLFWSYFQYTFATVTGKNINQILFADILQMWSGNITQYKNGHIAISGLNVNAGLLPPILMFLYVYTSKKWIRVLLLLLFFISGSSTMALCGLMLLGISMFVKMKEMRSNGIRIRANYLVSSAAIGVAAATVIFQPNIYNRMYDIFSLLVSRLTSVRSANYLDGSTFAHARYFTSIPYILSNINPINALFGFGIRCGGVPFVKFFNQYPDLIYGTECDITLSLYGMGLVGLAVMYWLLFCIVLKGKKLDSKYLVFIVPIILSGLFYSIQLNWVLLVEWMLFWGVKRKMDFTSLMMDVKLKSMEKTKKF